MCYSKRDTIRGYVGRSVGVSLGCVEIRTTGSLLILFCVFTPVATNDALFVETQEKAARKPLSSKYEDRAGS